jgi:hypothetical protein
MKPTLNAPGSERSKLKYPYDKLLSKFASSFNLHRYTKVDALLTVPELVQTTRGLGDGHPRRLHELAGRVFCPHGRAVQVDPDVYRYGVRCIRTLCQIRTDIGSYSYRYRVRCGGAG